MVRVERPAGYALRWTRAALLAGAAMLFGVLAHVSAGGLLPGATSLAALFGMCLLPVAAFLGRPASTSRVLLLLMAGQAFIHGALTALAGHRDDPPTTRTPEEAPALLEPVQHLVEDMSGPHALMALAHLAAAAALGFWLAVGERALWTVLALTLDGLCEVVRAAVDSYRSALPRPAGGADPRPRAQAWGLHAAEDIHLPLLRVFLSRSVIRRGPPALLAA